MQERTRDTGMMDSELLLLPRRAVHAAGWALGGRWAGGAGVKVEDSRQVDRWTGARRCWEAAEQRRGEECDVVAHEAARRDYTLADTT